MRCSPGYEFEGTRSRLGWRARTTGSAMTLAYSVYDETYASVPAFLFMRELPPKSYRHEPMQSFFAERGFQSAPFHDRRSFEGFWEANK